MEQKKFRFQVKVRAELVYIKEVYLSDRESAAEYANHILDNEIFEDWEFHLYETGESTCRIYEEK